MGMGNNFTSYLSEILKTDPDTFNYLINSTLAKFLIYSQALGLEVLIYLLVCEIPKIICNFFYSNLKLKNCILVLLAIAIAYILSSPSFIGLSLKTNSYLYAVLGWFVMYGELILAGLLKKQKQNEN